MPGLRLLAILGAALVLAACGRREAIIASDIAAGYRPGTFVALDQAVDDAIRNNEVPGLVLAVGRNGALVYERAAGYTDLTREKLEPVTPDTLFDVASLTKPVVTASAAAILICREEMSHDELLYRHTIDQHLKHATDLPPYMDWKVIERARGGASPVETIVRLLDEDYRGPRRYRSIGYSNLGYVLVGAAVEKRSGTDMESYLRANIWEPLGMKNTTFRPPADVSITRTAKDVEPGRPFDQLADYLLANWEGHVPGHSGLFSTAEDLTRFAQALLEPEKSKIPEMNCIADYLLKDQAPKQIERNVDVAIAAPPGRTPAFDLDGYSPGKAALVQTGYTGTMIWLHPESGTSVVLLTNSVHSDAEGWDKLRRNIIRAMWNGLER